MLKNAVDCVARSILYGRKLAARQEKAGWNPGKLVIADLPDATDCAAASHDEPVIVYPRRDVGLNAVIDCFDEAKQQLQEKALGRPIVGRNVFPNRTNS
ncbi:MAG: hypothetical protein B7Z29_17890 [Hyphomicrobium sp. 12-62-95]|nr:MAG: hypothetical protein B7Z29_17890 [Hyphomicrobium sp. 12-62-95]